MLGLPPASPARVRALGRARARARRATASCASRSRICCCCARPRGSCASACRPGASPRRCASCARACPRRDRSRACSSAPRASASSRARARRAGRSTRARCCSTSSARAAPADGAALPPLADLPARRSGVAAAAATAARAQGRRSPTGDVALLSIEELYELGCDPRGDRSRAGRGQLRQVLARAPHHADAHINLGRLLHERGDLEGAEGHYRQALAQPARGSDGDVQPRRRARGPGRASPRRSRPTRAPSRSTRRTPTLTTTPRASTRRAATTARRCATCAPTAT